MQYSELRINFVLVADLANSQKLIKDLLNFGWKKMEGNHIYIDEEFSNTKSMINPIFEYPNKFEKHIYGFGHNSEKDLLLLHVDLEIVSDEFVADKIINFIQTKIKLSKLI